MVPQACEETGRTSETGTGLTKAEPMTDTISYVPHWAAVQRDRDERRAAYTAALIDDFASWIAPEFAARVKQRDRWLNELGHERRTFPASYWEPVDGFPFVYQLTNGEPRA